MVPKSLVNNAFTVGFSKALHIGLTLLLLGTSTLWLEASLPAQINRLVLARLELAH